MAGGFSAQSTGPSISHTCRVHHVHALSDMDRAVTIAAFLTQTVRRLRINFLAML